MRAADRRPALSRTRDRRGGAALALARVLGLVLACALPFDRAAHAAAPRYTFAVIANTLQSPEDDAPTQRLIEAIGRERSMSFIVYGGNLKGAAETCDDALYQERQQLLQASRAPLVFIPGQHDWVDCATPQAGGYDAGERLDLIRQALLSDASSMGQNPLALARESDVARFRPYRENVRWQAGDTVFVGLNVPGGNNHYLSAGGRNGEFEDRVVATSFWLGHAAEYAKRRRARALVIFMEGAPDWKRHEHADRFAWLRFDRSRPRDGYLEFKRSLVKTAQIFRGPIVLIHSDGRKLPAGFTIDQPLFNDKGARVTNVTRIAIAPRERLSQWIQVEVDFGREPPFRVSVKDVPKSLPVPPAPETMPREEPAIPPVPDASGLWPAPPASRLPPAPDNRHVTPVEPPASPGSELAPESAAPVDSVQRGT